MAHDAEPDDRWPTCHVAASDRFIFAHRIIDNACCQGRLVNCGAAPVCNDASVGRRQRRRGRCCGRRRGGCLPDWRGVGPWLARAEQHRHPRGHRPGKPRPTRHERHGRRNRLRRRDGPSRHAGVRRRREQRHVARVGRDTGHRGRSWSGFGRIECHGVRHRHCTRQRWRASRAAAITGSDRPLIKPPRTGPEPDSRLPSRRRGRRTGRHRHA